MAILTFPSITPETQTFGINYNTQISSNPLSGHSQTVEMPGARWKGSISFSDMTQVEAADLKVFMLELRGSAGRFYFGDLSHTSPQIPVTGSPTVTGGTNRIITTTVGSGTFTEGDYIQIGSDVDRELKMIINANNTGGNNWSLTVEPMIRRTDYSGKDIIYTNPTGVFLLASDVQAAWSSRSKALLSDMALDFIEIFS